MDDYYDVDRAECQIAEMQERIERLEAALVEMVGHSPIEEMRMGGYGCIYCQAWNHDYHAVAHLANCPHRRAASLLQTTVKNTVTTP